MPTKKLKSKSHQGWQLLLRAVAGFAVLLIGSVAYVYAASVWNPGAPESSPDSGNVGRPVTYDDSDNVLIGTGSNTLSAKLAVRDTDEYGTEHTVLGVYSKCSVPASGKQCSNLIIDGNTDWSQGTRFVSWHGLDSNSKTAYSSFHRVTSPTGTIASVGLSATEYGTNNSNYFTNLSNLSLNSSGSLSLYSWNESVRNQPKFGIGNDSPEYPLDINVYDPSSSASKGIRIKGDTSGGGDAILSLDAGSASSDGSAILFGKSGTYGFKIIGGGNDLYLNSNGSTGGYVYIFPGSVTGILPTQSGLAIGNSYNGTAEVNLFNSNYTTATTAFQFSQMTSSSAKTDLMTMKSSGYIGIGTTSPSTYLHLYGNNTAGYGQLTVESNSGSADSTVAFRRAGSLVGALKIQSNNEGLFWATGNIHLQPGSSSNYVWTDTKLAIAKTNPSYALDVNGDVGATAFYYTSDERFKKNIQTVTGALDKIEQLRGVNFEWRTDEYPAHQFQIGKQVGLIAQEVEKVLPEAVHTAQDGYKSVEYGNLVGVLIEAVKEQQKEIEVLKNEVANLKK